MNIFDWSHRLKLQKSTGFVSGPELQHKNRKSQQDQHYFTILMVMNILAHSQW
jgi:hypothetical protein